MGEPSALGKNLLRLREAAGMSQVALARAAAVSQALLSRLESGERQDAGGALLRRVAGALGVTVDDLLREADERAHEAPGRDDAGGGGSEAPERG